MSLCEVCDQEMTPNAGCGVETFVYRGQQYRRLPFGGERYTPANFETCRDCATPRGSIHHAYCCIEQCPVCDGQLLGCGHWDLYGVEPESFGH